MFKSFPQGVKKLGENFLNIATVKRKNVLFSTIRGKTTKAEKHRLRKEKTENKGKRKKRISHKKRLLPLRVENNFCLVKIRENITVF